MKPLTLFYLSAESNRTRFSFATSYSAKCFLLLFTFILLINSKSSLGAAHPYGLRRALQITIQESRLKPHKDPIRSMKMAPLIASFERDLDQLHGEEKYNYALSRIAPHDLYKLFIDKKDHQQGAKSYDYDEPGYHDAMMKAFKSMSRTVDSPFDLETIVQFHDTAVLGVTRRKSAGVTRKKGEPFQQGMATGFGYGIVEWKISPNVDREWEEDLLIKRTAQVASVKKTAGEGYLASLVGGRVVSNLEQFVRFASRVDVVDLLQIAKSTLSPYFETYESEKQRAVTLQDKCRAIGKLIRAIEIFHIFPDGNQRTLAFLTLDRLLLDNNLPPAILDDAFLFDGYYSADEMAIGIESGILNFLEL